MMCPLVGFAHFWQALCGGDQLPLVCSYGGDGGAEGGKEKTEDRGAKGSSSRVAMLNPVIKCAKRNTHSDPDQVHLQKLSGEAKVPETARYLQSAVRMKKWLRSHCGQLIESFPIESGPHLVCAPPNSPWKAWPH